MSVPRVETFFSMQSLTVGSHTSDAFLHDIVTERSTVVIKAENFPAAATIDVGLYSCLHTAGDATPSPDGYWNLVTSFTITPSDIPDLDGTGNGAFHKTIIHPLLPYTKLKITVNGAVTTCEALLIVGM